MFEADGSVICFGKRWQRLRYCDRIREITCRAQRRELVSRDSVHRGRLIQLARIEAQRVSAHRRMARETFAARGNSPLLRDRRDAIRDRQVEVRAAVRDEIRFRARRVPRVADSVNAVRSLHDETCFDALLRGGIAACHFHVEVFHPNHSGGQRPVAIGGVCDCGTQTRNAKPTPLDGVISPISRRIPAS